MPKENKHSRGRRDEKKLKRKREKGEEEEQEEEVPTKRQRSAEPLEEQYLAFASQENAEPVEGESTDRPFYGMLEDEEQEYFRRADELLEQNDFPSVEDRSLFLANVYREADGKELKIACSQSCSRLMERLILLSSTEQKKNLFEKFSGNFAHLVQHRFASHCCETLFIQSAPVVTQELTGEVEIPAETNDSEVYVSMENLFLYTLNELEGQMTFLLTDRFASHTLRVLLVVLSGRPLEQASTRTLLQSKKKEKIGINGMDSAPTSVSLSKRAVPESFQFAIDKIITDTIASMDTAFIRVLATHPTGNPSLQLLLELELTNPTSKKGQNSSEKTIISALLPDDITKPNSDSATFVNGLIYEAIGSRLLETIMAFAPGKLFKQIYRSVFKERIAALARNEIASYVVIRVLTRLSKEDLEEAVTNILPQIEGLVTRNRTTVIKTLLERCDARGASAEALTAEIAKAYGSEPSTLILKMADVDVEVLTKATAAVTVEEVEPKAKAAAPVRTTPQQLHGSLLAQSMLAISGPPSTLIQEGLLALPSSTLVTLSLYTTTSHIIQTSLQPTATNLTFRRKLINLILSASPSPILQLASTPTGSHTLDALFIGTSSLLSLKERIALDLLSREAALRDSFTGRIVWRNWMLDLFKRKRGEWIAKVKAGEGGGSSSASSSLSAVVAAKGAGESNEGGGKDKKKDKAASGKSAIELAREKFAKSKNKKKLISESKGTGSNAIFS
ncbi:Nucleolar protein 9 [Phlyctema vagabunda]|uniref:Nucleolar protein 9 n=1 Tax=Phlyctema vagabunda TaxID=108571 RepID=A0ABR4PSP6_9HELO